MRAKRSSGEGSIRRRGASLQWRYRDQMKTVNPADYASKKEINRAFSRWRDELDAKIAAAKSGPVLSMNDLFDKYIKEQRINEREQLYMVQKMTDKYLRPRLGHIVATELTSDDISDYIERRKQERTYKHTLTRNGTINRELGTIISSLLMHRPNPIDLKIRKLDESDGVRQGLITEEVYRALLAELEPYQKPLWAVAYYSGVRQGQLLKLRRAWVDFTEWIIHTPGRDEIRQRVTKNAKPHYIPLYMPIMQELVKWAYDTGDPACPYLFQRRGKRISKSTFYCAMKRACERIGQADLMFHDTRRTAVTSMIEAGISPDDAMAVSGHADPSVFKRYGIISDTQAKASVKKVGTKMARWHQKSAADLAKIWPREDEDLDTPPGIISKYKQ